QSDGGIAPGVRLQDVVRADAGGAGADAGGLPARRRADVHGLHGALSPVATPGIACQTKGVKGVKGVTFSRGRELTPLAGWRGWWMDTYLVSYDIADPKRLRKVATACEDFGVRKQ